MQSRSVIGKNKSESASMPPNVFWCLNDKTIKELMSFAKCETGKMPYDYVEAIHSSRHMLWPIWLHILNVNKDKKNFIKEERREWIDKDYQHKLIEDTKSSEDHDSD
jgi:hypothetical protein